MYGKSRESLVRSEGARRVRQAELLGSGILKNQMFLLSSESNTFINLSKNSTGSIGIFNLEYDKEGL